MLSRTEARILRSLAVLARQMAVDGCAGDGYTTLLEGLSRVKKLRDGGDPCGDELMTQYRHTLDDYARRYHVARE